MPTGWARAAVKALPLLKELVPGDRKPGSSIAQPGLWRFYRGTEDSDELPGSLFDAVTELNQDPACPTATDPRWYFFTPEAAIAALGVACCRLVRDDTE